MVCNTNGSTSSSPWIHRSILDRFPRRFISDIVAKFGKDVMKICIASNDIFSMCRQVGIDNANRRIVKLQPDTNSTLVPHHPHDTYTNAFGLYAFNSTLVRGFDKDTKHET